MKCYHDYVNPPTSLGISNEKEYRFEKQLHYRSCSYISPFLLSALTPPSPIPPPLPVSTYPSSVSLSQLFFLPPSLLPLFPLSLSLSPTLLLPNLSLLPSPSLPSFQPFYSSSVSSVSTSLSSFIPPRPPSSRSLSKSLSSH